MNFSRSATGLKRERPMVPAATPLPPWKTNTTVTGCSLGRTQESRPPSVVRPADHGISAQMDRAWEVTWNRFYLPKVQTFADYLSSYENGREQAHLPTAEEVQRQFPNPCGYSTGMEDGAILGGAMLSVLCDRFAVTGEESLRGQAADVFAGLRRCVTVHGVRGFVARNVCPEDGRSVTSTPRATKSPISCTASGSITTARWRTRVRGKRCAPFSPTSPNA